MSLQKVSEDTLVKDAEDVKILGSTDGGTTWVAIRTDAAGNVVTIPLGNLITVDFDYVGGTYPDPVTEVFTYKTGGAGGTTVATVTMVYSDASKEVFLSMTKT